MTPLNQQELNNSIAGSKILRSSMMNPNEWCKTWYNHDHSFVRTTYNKNNKTSVKTGTWEVFELDNVGYLQLTFKTNNSKSFIDSKHVNVGPFHKIYTNGVCTKMSCCIPATGTMDYINVYKTINNSTLSNNKIVHNTAKLTSNELHKYMIGNKIIRASTTNRNKWHRSFFHHDGSFVRNTYLKTDLIGVTTGKWEIYELDNVGYVRLLYSNIHMNNSNSVSNQKPIIIGPCNLVCKNDVCTKMNFYLPAAKMMDCCSIYKNC
jgi:hypothetical protein